MQRLSTKVNIHAAASSSGTKSVSNRTSGASIILFRDGCSLERTDHRTDARCEFGAGDGFVAVDQCEVVRRELRHVLGQATGLRFADSMRRSSRRRVNFVSIWLCLTYIIGLRYTSGVRAAQYWSCRLYACCEHGVHHRADNVRQTCSYLLA